jgi:N6-L-threonylcarbamoyladenine synthase
LSPLRIRLSYPPVEFCTDNAAMIASAAFFHLWRGERHGLDLDVQPGLSLPFSASSPSLAGRARGSAAP